MRRVSSITFLLVVTSLVLIAPQMSFIPSQATETGSLKPVLDCATTPDEACIEEINLILSDGTKRRAKLTGRTTSETRTYAPNSVLRAQWEEYAFEGVRFGGKAGGAFIPRIFFFPQGNLDCFYDPCVDGGEYLEFAVAATWLNGPPSNTPLPLPYRKSNLACGVKTNPGYCYEPTNFNIDGTFELQVRIPSSFKTIASTGRGVQDFTLVRRGTYINSKGMTFDRITVQAKPLAYSGYGFSGADIDEYADFESDQVVVWLWGETDRRVKRIGRCSAIPKLSVVSNIFHASFPMWDTSEQSIYVNVAGPHFRSDGKVNYGTIQMKVSEALADCLWSVDISKKVEAKVSITYEESGQQQTQSVSSRLKGDEFILTISGMHFSSPTVKVKLAQSTERVGTVLVDSATTSIGDPSGNSKLPTNGTAKKSSVVKCKKGNIVKKVSSEKSRCPKGFRRI
jgi:hypothetical protein